MGRENVQQCRALAWTTTTMGGSGARARFKHAVRQGILATMGESELVDEVTRLKLRVAELEREGALSVDPESSIEQQMLVAAEQVAPLGAFVWDAYSGQVSASNGLRALLTLAPETSLTPSSALDLVNGPDRKRLQRLLKLALRGVPVHPTNFQVTRADGKTLELVGTVSAELDENGTVHLLRGSVLEVTNQRQIESRLRQTQKLEAIGTLAGGVAHDFNNFLQVVVGNCDLIRRDVSLSERSRSAVTQVEAATSRCQELIRRLLAFGRKQEHAPTLNELNDLVQSSASMIERIIGEDVRLTVTTQYPCPVRVDPLQFEQVLVNLAVNARDAMPHGGTLAISVAPVFLDTRAAEADALPPGHYCRVVVKDSGEGMTEAVRERIFEPFFSTKPRGTGTGLGLATVHGIMHQARGTVHVESRPGAGTVFTLLLPLSGSQPSLAQVSAEPETHPGGNETILVVEDAPLVRAVTQQQLQQAGYRVIAVGSSAEAIEAAKSLKELSLLLADVMMPDKNGAELAAELQRLRPGLPVIFMSGYTERVVLNRAALPLANVALRKPFSRSELLTCVRRKLDRWRPT